MVCIHSVTLFFNRSPSLALTPGIDAEAEVPDEPSALSVREENGQQHPRQNAELDHKQPLLR